MANSERRHFNRYNKQFIPMNLNGGFEDTSSLTGKKALSLVGIVASLVIIIAYLNMNYASLRGYIFFIALWFIVSQYVIRYVVFEEKYYYKMYLVRKGNEITTPKIAWDVASIKESEDGAILIYSDARIGAIVRVDRDTIVAKNDGFREVHYDCISDFIGSLNKKNYNFLHLDMMETAGNDPRLPGLDDIPKTCTNDNVKRLVEQQIGHIKKIEQNSLCETDYYLILTGDTSRLDRILSDIDECFSILMYGGYKRYKVLSTKELVNLKKRHNGVDFFDMTDASLSVYDNLGYTSTPLTVTGILWENGELLNIDKSNRHILERAISEFDNGTDLIMDSVDIYSRFYNDTNKDASNPTAKGVLPGFGFNKNNQSNGSDDLGDVKLTFTDEDDEDIEIDEGIEVDFEEEDFDFSNEDDDYINL